MFLLMAVYDKKNPSIVLQKKRYFLMAKYPRLRFGDIGIATGGALRFEYIYFFYMRKFLKRTIKKKKIFFYKRKIWVFIRPNQVLTKKGKNSRMGKGKGSFIRWCTLLPKGFIFVEFKGLTYMKIMKYKKKLQNKFKIPLYLVFLKNSFHKLPFYDYGVQSKNKLVFSKNLNLFY